MRLEIGLGGTRARLLVLLRRLLLLLLLLLTPVSARWLLPLMLVRAPRMDTSGTAPSAVVPVLLLRVLRGATASARGGRERDPKVASDRPRSMVVLLLVLLVLRGTWLRPPGRASRLLVGRQWGVELLVVGLVLGRLVLLLVGLLV